MSRADAYARRRRPFDFSDYLEARLMRDDGRADTRTLALLSVLEEALPVKFVNAIPHMVTLADAADAPPREVTREALRVVFAMRHEFAAHGTTRRGLMGFPLPEGEGLKDWLDFLETERKNAKQVRELMRELDRKVWALMTGERRMPTTPVEEVVARLGSATPLHESL